MKADYTAGPWEPLLYMDPRWLVSVKGEPNHVICVTSQGNDEANARLLAAAPELLAACEELLKEFPTPGDGQPLEEELNELRAAVAKAKG